MLYRVLIILILLIGNYSAYSQCSSTSGGTNRGSITPTATWQTVSGMYGMDYYTFSATAGEIYTFSFCSADGGTDPGLDFTLTINDNSGNIVTGAFDDDGCGTSGGPPRLTWTATGTGTYRILAAWYYAIDDQCSATYYTTGTLAYKKNSGQGTTCSLPIVINSYPHSSSNTTCGMGDDYGVQTSSCSNYYGEGEDIVYQLTGMTTQTYTITVTGTSGSYVAWFLKSSAGCTNTSSSLACAVSSSGTVATNTFAATAGNTYYLIIDTWPSPDCVDFTLTINPSGAATCPGGLGTGYVDINNATSPDSLGANYSTSGTTQGMVDDLTSTNTTVCGSSYYYTGQDKVYFFTPASSGNINISLTSAGSYTGLMLYEGCPLLNQGGTCVAYVQSSTGNKSMCAYVTARVNYYLIIDSYDSPDYNAFSNLTITAPSGDNTGHDCDNAQLISSLPFNSGAKSTACTGNDYNNSSTASCATSYESGEDYVFKYIASGPECISLTLSGLGTSSTGCQIYKGCPDETGSSCIGSFYGATTSTQTLPTSGTYYIIVDTDGSVATNTNFTLSITSSGSGPANDEPCNATMLNLGDIIGGDNSCSSSFNEPSTPSCFTSGNRNTVWYKMVAPASGKLKIRTGLITLTNTQIALYSGTCGTGMSQVACNDDQAACGSNIYTTSEISATGLTSGATYYLCVDGTNNSTGTFSVQAVDGNDAFPDAPGQDCGSTIDICNQELSVGNPGYQAIGNLCDFSSGNCLLSGERGSAWYRIPIAAAGTLVFTLVPNDYDGTPGNETDYDFAIWKVKNSSAQSFPTCATCATCSDIKNQTNNYAPVKCNYSYLGVTGLSSNGNTPSPYSGYDAAFETAISVLANEEYLLNISNYSNSTQGFTINFQSGSPIAYSASPTSLTWTGGAGNTDWFNKQNWGGCAYPNENINVVIAPSSSYQPIINGTDPYIPGQNARCKSLTINPGATLTINSGKNLEIYGNYYNAGTLAADDASTVYFMGGTAQTADGNMLSGSNFGNVIITKTANSVTLAQDMEVAGNFSTTNGTSDFNTSTYKLKVAGNINLSAVTFSGTGTLEAYGAGSPTITTNSNSLYKFNVNKTTTITLADALTVTNELQLEAGSLDVSSNNFSITMNGSNWKNIGGEFISGTGTVTFTGGSSNYVLSMAVEFYNVTLNKTGGTLTLYDHIVITNDLILTAGILDASSNNYSITLNGDWVNAGGSFTPRAGTVKFAGSATQFINVTTAGGTTPYNNHFTFFNVVCDGSDVRVYYNKTTSKQINVNGDLKVNEGKSFNMYGI